MPRTDEDPLVCKCGRQGYLVLKDSSMPYRCSLEFSVEGFTGAVITVADYHHIPDDILAAVNPICPDCGGVGTVAPPPRTEAENAELVRLHIERERSARRRPASKK